MEVGTQVGHWSADLPAAEMRKRPRVIASAVSKFKTKMMGVIGDEGELDYAEYTRKLVIWDYDLTIAEAADFNREIGYTPPIN